MRSAASLPVVHSRLEEWCQICGNRSLENDLSYCRECAPAYKTYCEAKEQRQGLSPRIVAVAVTVIGGAAVLLLAAILLAV
jgi:hypothetical protein